MTNLSTDQHDLIDRAVALLREVEGVRAIVLGGSYATCRQRLDSDIDLAIYYSESQALDIASVRRVANELSTVGPVDVTELYGWGNWVNGGAWLTTSAGRMDFLYRNIEQIQRTIDEAHRGIVHHDYQQQPPTGFYSVTYLGETHACVPLHDPQRTIGNLKDTVAIYPPAMKDTIVRNSLWSAEFTLLCLQKHVAMADVYNTVACFTRISACLTQAIYALNERYFMSDKAIAHDIAEFRRCPRDYILRATTILASPGTSSQELDHSRSALKTLWKEIVDLSGDYQPRF